MPCANAKREKVGMRKKVMIVEDNELNLKLFTDLLRAHQFTVEGVRDGRLALERALSFAPDLVIMAAGAKGYLSKPVPAMKFLEAVRGIVDWFMCSEKPSICAAFLVCDLPESKRAPEAP